LLAALVVLLPSGAASRAQYLCRMTGRILADASCDSGAKARPTAAVAELRAENCCQRILSSSKSAALGTREAIQPVLLATVLPTLAPPLRGAGPACADSVCSESTQAPLAIGPPLFVVHCAFLS